MKRMAQPLVRGAKSALVWIAWYGAVLVLCAGVAVVGWLTDLTQPDYPFPGP